MKHLRRLVVGMLPAGKGKRTDTEMIKQPMLNCRTIFDHLKMASNANTKPQTKLLNLGSVNIPCPRVWDDLFSSLRGSILSSNWETFPNSGVRTKPICPSQHVIFYRSNTSALLAPFTRK